MSAWFLSGIRLYATYLLINVHRTLITPTSILPSQVPQPHMKRFTYPTNDLVPNPSRRVLSFE